MFRFLKRMFNKHAKVRVRIPKPATKSQLFDVLNACIKGLYGDEYRCIDNYRGIHVYRPGKPVDEDVVFTFTELRHYARHGMMDCVKHIRSKLG